MSGLFTLPPGFANYVIGLDRLFDDLNLLDVRLSSPSNQHHYPPHNLVKEDDTHYTLSLAVAGFLPEELEVEVEKNTLTVRSHSAPHDAPEGGRYVHRGIAMRNFTKTFVLAENVEVGDITLEHGILSIRLSEIVPETARKRLLPINTPKALTA